MDNLRKGVLLGIGNPLLDLTIVGTPEFLQKYKLEANNAVIANDEQKQIYDDIFDNYEVEFTAGGSVQNSLRVCQWILGKPKCCVFMGSVGTDKYSEILQRTAERDGVEVRYQFQKDVPTGTCAVIVTTHRGHQRSLVANLSAAEKFTMDHILKPENFELIKEASFYYISGFFLTVSPDTVNKVGETAAKESKLFVANLSAPFVCNFYKKSLLRMICYTDIVFGNCVEAQTLAEDTFGTNDIKEICIKMANLPKENKKRSRIVVITQGQRPVLFVQGNNLMEVPVPFMPEEKVVDTNGAGDAFAGGFLSQLIQGKSIEKCIECGIWAAQHIIQRSGCSFDRNVRFNL